MPDPAPAVAAPAPDPGSDKPSLIERSGYAVAQLSLNTYWQLFMMLQLFFYTDIFGITAAQAGTMFLVTRLWDAFTDPMVGILADKTNTRFGRYRPWFAWAALPFAVLGVLAFSTPDLGDSGKLVYAYVTYSALMLAYTAVGIPLNSMIGVASPRSEVRTTLSSWHMFGAFTASMFAQLFTLRLVDYLGGVDYDASEAAQLAAKQSGFSSTTMIFSVVAVVSLFYAFAVMRERVGLPPAARGAGAKAKPGETEAMGIDPVEGAPGPADAAPTGADTAPPLRRQLAELLRSRAWIVLFSVFMMMCLFISIRGAAQIFYFKYYLGVDGDTVTLAGFEMSASLAQGIYLALGSVGCLIGTPLISPLTRLIGQRMAFFTLIALSVIVAAAHFPLGRDAVLMALLLQTLVGLFSGPLFVLKNSMLADVADELELNNGHRATGLVYSAASFSFKFGFTFGGFIAALALDWIGYDKEQELTTQTIDGLRYMMSWLPILPMGIAAVLLLFYPLTSKQIRANEQALAARRAA